MNSVILYDDIENLIFIANYINIRVHIQFIELDKNHSVTNKIMRIP